MPPASDNSRESRFVRSVLPPELISLVDNAEANAQSKIDEIVDDFTGRVRAKIEELAEHDFAAELQEAVDEEQKVLIEKLAKSAESLADKIDEINEMAQNAELANDEFQTALGQLKSARNALQTELEKTRKGVAKLGSTVGKTAKGVISKFLGGIF